jgi:hypothetical protein
MRTRHCQNDAVDGQRRFIDCDGFSTSRRSDGGPTKSPESKGWKQIENIDGRDRANTQNRHTEKCRSYLRYMQSTKLENNANLLRHGLSSHSGSSWALLSQSMQLQNTFDSQSAVWAGNAPFRLMTQTNVDQPTLPCPTTYGAKSNPSQGVQYSRHPRCWDRHRGL